VLGYGLRTPGYGQKSAQRVPRSLMGSGRWLEGDARSAWLRATDSGLRSEERATRAAFSYGLWALARRGRAQCSTTGYGLRTTGYGQRSAQRAHSLLQPTAYSLELTSSSEL